MRTFLGAMLAVGVLSGVARADEADAVKLIEKLGGKIERDDKQPGNPVVAVDFSETQVKDADLKGLKELKEIRRLSLAFTQITNDGLKELKDLKQLSSLSLNGTKVTDVGLKELRELKGLRVLLLTKTQVTEAGVKEFQEALPKCKIIR